MQMGKVLNSRHKGSSKRKENKKKFKLANFFTNHWTHTERLYLNTFLLVKHVWAIAYQTFLLLGINWSKASSRKKNLSWRNKNKYFTPNLVDCSLFASLASSGGLWGVRPGCGSEWELSIWNQGAGPPSKCQNSKCPKNSKCWNFHSVKCMWFEKSLIQVRFLAKLSLKILLTNLN